MWMRRALVACMAIGVTLAAGGCENRSNPVLAKVGERALRAQDFLQSYGRISPQFRPDLSSPQAREEFLLNLVRRDVLLDEARARGIDKNRVFVMQFEDTRKGVLGPALMKEIAKGRPEPPDTELGGILLMLKQRYHLRVLAADAAQELEGPVKELEAGKPWLEVEKEWLAASPPAETGRRGGDQGWQNLGDYPEQLWKAIALLTPGQRTPVVEFQGMAYLFYVEGREDAGVASEEILRKKAIEVWQRDTDVRTAMAFLDSLRSSLAYQVNEPLLGQVIERFQAAAEPGKKAGQNPEAWPTFTDAELRTDLASWRGGNMVLDDFLYRLREYPDMLRPSMADLPRLRRELDNLTADRLMMQEAERRGLDKREDLGWEMQKTYEQRLIRRVRAEILGSLEITDDMVKAYYEANIDSMHAPAEYEAHVAVMADSARADSLYNVIRMARSSIEDVARKYSIHRESAAKGGDLGWIGAHTYEDLYYVLRATGPRRMSRPFRALGGWAIVFVEGTRGTRTATLEEASEAIKNVLLRQEEERLLAEWLDKKIAEVVKLYPQRLTKVQIPADLLPSAAQAGVDSLAPGLPAGKGAAEGETK